MKTIKINAFMNFVIVLIVLIIIAIGTFILLEY